MSGPESAMSRAEGKDVKTITGTIAGVGTNSSGSAYYSVNTPLGNFDDVPSVVGNCNINDQVTGMFHDPVLKRNMVIVENSTSVLADSNDLEGFGSVSNDQWLTPEGLASQPYGLTAPFDPFPLFGASISNGSINRTNNFSSVTQDSFRGLTDPRGLNYFVSQGTKTLSGLAIAYSTSSAIGGNTDHIILNEYYTFADGSTSFNSFSISYPTGHCEQYNGGREIPSGIAFEPDSKGCLHFLATPNATGMYVVPLAAGILTFQREGQIVTWSPYIVDTLRGPDRSRNCSVSSVVPSSATTGVYYFLEGAYPTLINDAGICSTGSRAMLYEYQIDSNFDSTNGQAVPMPPIDISSIPPNGVLKIFGVGGEVGGIDITISGNTNTFLLNFQSGGSAYTNWNADGFDLVAPGSGDTSMCYSAANVFGYDYRYQTQNNGWPELTGGNAWFFYINSIDIYRKPWFQIVRLRQDTQVMNSMHDLQASGTILYPTPAGMSSQQAAKIASCLASYAPSSPSASVQNLQDIGGNVLTTYCYTVGQFYTGHNNSILNSGSGLSASMSLGPDNSGGQPDLEQWVIHPLHKDMDDTNIEFAEPARDKSGTTVTYKSMSCNQSPSGVFDEALQKHFIAVSEPMSMAVGYDVFPMVQRLADFPASPDNRFVYKTIDFSTTPATVVDNEPTPLAMGLVGVNSPPGSFHDYQVYENITALGTNTNLQPAGGTVNWDNSGTRPLYAVAVTGNNIYRDVWRTLLVCTTTGDLVPNPDPVDITQYVSWTGYTTGGGFLSNPNLVDAVNWPVLHCVWKIACRGNYIFILRQWIANFVTPDDYSKRTPHLEIRNLSDSSLIARFNLLPPSKTNAISRTVVHPKLLVDYDANGNPYCTCYTEWDDSTYTSGDDWSLRYQSETRITMMTGTPVRTDNLCPVGYPSTAPALVEIGTAARVEGNLLAFKEGQNIQKW